MLQVADKHSTYIIDHEDGDRAAALALLKERVQEGYWYENWDDGDEAHQYEDRAAKIANSGNEIEAYYFIVHERSDFEYEDVRTIEPRRMK